MAANQTLKVKRSEVKKLIEVTFPEYTGRKIAIEFTERVSFWDTNWGGGTRNSYAAVSERGHARLNVPAPWNNPVDGKTIDLPTDVLIVVHKIFCGHDLGLTIYAHPTHAPKWLSA